MMEEIIEFIGIIIVLLLFIGVLSVFSIIISLKIAQKINDRRVKNNKYLKPNDKEQINKFIEKDYQKIIFKNKDNYNITDDDYWYLEDTIRHVESLCRYVLAGEKKLYTIEEEVFEKEFENFVNEIKDKEISNINKELKEMKKIIFKYYDKDGNLKIRKV